MHGSHWMEYIIPITSVCFQFDVEYRSSEIHGNYDMRRTPVDDEKLWDSTYFQMNIRSTQGIFPFFVFVFGRVRKKKWTEFRFSYLWLGMTMICINWSSICAFRWLCWIETISIFHRLFIYCVFFCCFSISFLVSHFKNRYSLSVFLTSYCFKFK